MINDEMISQMSHYNSLKSRILFEISSWIGRKFCRNRSKIPLTKEPLLLDLGVGDNYKDDWIHADFFSCPRHFNPLKILFSRKDKTKRLPEVETDLRYPLNCPDDSIDGVYFSHTIEHLLPHEAINLIREIYRVLKPNKWLRIIVPDLKFSVESYYGRNSCQNSPVARRL
ncbi:MAG: methyltransferase domain-containing protein [Candidatus Electryonea clarkiae]|nr:methyltransferase domain-containing protein [Candidatus Electryonea clarkiae]